MDLKFDLFFYFDALNKRVLAEKRFRHTLSCMVSR